MNFLDNFNVDRFLFSLQYMWKGMLCIFIVIGVIILSIYGMNKLFGSLAEKKKAKEEAKNAENN